MIAKNFSVRNCDQYLDHLARISFRGNKVRANSDLYNEFGVLLMRSEATLDKATVEKLDGHRLNTDVDEVLVASNCLSASDLAGRSFELFSEEADLGALANATGSDDRLRHLLHTADISPRLLQRLTVMECVQPRVYHRALFCAWLASLIAIERERSPEEINLCLLAGLCHDFGLLHIPPDLVDKKHDLEPEDWTWIQRHVLYGALIAESLGNYPTRLAKIVAQHHERCDGAGYPTGRTERDLDPLSQVIALCDMLHELRFRRLLGNTNDDLRGCMAFLKVNSRTFGKANYHSIAKLIKGAVPRRTPGAPARQLPTVEQLLVINDHIEQMLNHLTIVTDELTTLSSSRLSESLLSLVKQVQWVCLSSGLGSEAMALLVADLAEDPAADSGYLDTVKLAREVIWLIRRIDRQLKEFCGQCASDAGTGALLQSSAAIESALGEAWKSLH